MAGRVSPFVPTPWRVVREALRVADVKPGELVCDLGCGDGRFLVAAARDFGARAVGVEIRKDLVEKALFNAFKSRVAEFVKVLHGDFLSMKLPKADVVTLYQLTSLNRLLAPKLSCQLPRGARVVSVDFRIPGWIPVKKFTVLDEESTGKGYDLYLYVVGLSDDLCRASRRGAEELQRVELRSPRRSFLLARERQ